MGRWRRRSAKARSAAVLEDRLVYLAGVLALGVAAQWLAWSLRMPSILLLLAVGFIAGQFADTNQLIGEELLFPVVSLSVAVILFEGGLSLRVAELRQTGKALARLLSIGAVVTFVLSSLAAWYLLGLDVRVAALAGAVLVVTGPTVIMPMLRQIRPSRRVGSIVKWEGIVIDPIGASLAVLVFEVVRAGSTGQAVGSVILGLASTAAVGGFIGAVAALLIVQLLRRFLIPDYLDSPAILAVVLVAFTISNRIMPESGLLTVTILGVILANQKAVSLRHVSEFKENLQVLLISCLFIVLGSRIALGDIVALGWAGAAFLAVLILIVRPAAVFLSTMGTELTIRERTFLAFIAPRGIVAAAVSSVFGLELAKLAHESVHGSDSPQIAALAQQLADQAQRLAPLTFLVIVGTVVFYGVVSGPLARRLQLAVPDPQGVLFAGAEPWVRTIAKAVQEEGFPVLLVDTNYTHVAAAQMDGLRATCASILSEYAMEEIDLGGVGRLVALTPNDEVNSLATLQFAHLFGRREVYQLTPPSETTGRRESVGQHLRGRRLFGKDVTYEVLTSLMVGGSRVKTTRISEEFSYEDFRGMYGDRALVLFTVDSNRRLAICTADEPVKAKAGQTIIALVPPALETPAGEAAEGQAIA
jgi:NhaP-type Na+/H+ or K+/H+ antiporter